MKSVLKAAAKTIEKKSSVEYLTNAGHMRYELVEVGPAVRTN